MTTTMTHMCANESARWTLSCVVSVDELVIYTTCKVVVRFVDVI